jgi:hypothetical protein
MVRALALALTAPFTQSFVASQRNGQWDAATKVPDLGTVGKANTNAVSVSCDSAGNCTAISMDT